MLFPGRHKNTIQEFLKILKKKQTKEKDNQNINNNQNKGGTQQKKKENKCIRPVVLCVPYVFLKRKKGKKKQQIYGRPSVQTFSLPPNSSEKVAGAVMSPYAYAHVLFYLFF